MMTITFDGQDPEHITRTLTTTINCNLSLNRLEKIDAWLMQIIDSTLSPKFLKAVATKGAALPASLFAPWLQFIASAFCNATCAAAFFSCGWFETRVEFSLLLVIFPCY